ncbi:MAG: hypothetical protein JST85_02130 [Acidobacteria bacterium]|nr:hypothetical protein [Acidobacteriota bacterium]
MPGTKSRTLEAMRTQIAKSRTLEAMRTKKIFPVMTFLAKRSRLSRRARMKRDAAAVQYGLFKRRGMINQKPKADNLNFGGKDTC